MFSSRTQNLWHSVCQHEPNIGSYNVYTVTMSLNFSVKNLLFTQSISYS